MKIIIKHYTGEEIPVDVEETTMIKQLKELLANLYWKSMGVEMKYTQLVFQKKILKDDKTIADHGIKENETIDSIGMLGNWFKY